MATPSDEVQHFIDDPVHAFQDLDWDVFQDDSRSTAFHVSSSGLKLFAAVFVRPGLVVVHLGGNDRIHVPSFYIGGF